MVWVCFSLPGGDQLEKHPDRNRSLWICSVQALCQMPFSIAEMRRHPLSIIRGKLYFKGFIASPQTETKIL